MKGFDIQSETSVTGASVKKSYDGVYQFNAEPPQILHSALKNNPTAGITFPSFVSLLYRKRKSIHWKRYSHRIAALLCLSTFNSFLSLGEYIYVHVYLYLFRYSVLRTASQHHRHADPVFVLGHPRTGTTLLHSLLALDNERFAICDTFMAGFPHCFLWFESIGKFLFSGILSDKRPMDNMKLHFDLPQEDELGTNLLSGFRVSPYTSLLFLKDEAIYRKYQCLRTEDVTEHDLTLWTDSFGKLLWKIKVRDLLRQTNSATRRNVPRQLLLKSPCHTGRVRLLLKLFPNAKFVFIHRNPYEVFLSGAHMAETTYGWMFLQPPTNEEMQEYILRQGEILHGEYFSCKSDESLLHKDNCVEASFEELTKDPFMCVGRIYRQLGFDSFDPMVASSYPDRLSKECEELKEYQRNKFDHVVLDDNLKEIIKIRWKDQFDILGYSKDYPPND